jgi:hypothetical protein
MWAAWFNMHFTPTPASWMNMVERFFRDITANRLRRGVLTNVPELATAADEYKGDLRHAFFNWRPRKTLITHVALAQVMARL